MENENSVRVVNVKGHYEIYVNDKFECSCDVNELKETLDEISKKYNFV